MSPSLIKRSAVSELIRKIRAAAEEKAGYQSVKLRQKNK
jgi:putative molybdopterin biosynthesis protein